MATQFDGTNLTITLDAGVTEVDIIDVYSDWKTWVLAGNAQYPAAFRVVGGDPLSSIINAGSYFFLRNDYGWRLKPPEEDTTIYLTGNLAVQDTALPAFIPTTGSFTTAILGLQPVTQGVTPAMGSQLAFSSFDGAVWVDQSNGTPGTGTINGNPIGTPEYPVNNIPDAVIISQERGLPERIKVVGSLVLDTGDDVDFFGIEGKNPVQTVVTVNPGASTLGTEFRGVTLTGTLDGQSVARQTLVTALQYVNGFVFESVLPTGTITLGGTLSSTAYFLSCFSGVPGGDVDQTPTIDMAGDGPALVMRNYSGGIKLINKTGLSACSIDLLSGQVVIDSTCTAGQITVRGVGKVVDENGIHLGSGVINGGLTLNDEVAYGAEVHEIWEATTYNGAIHLDTNNGQAGTTHLLGSYKYPVNNFADAITLAGLRGLQRIQVVEDAVVGATDVLDGLQIEGSHATKSQITLTAGCSTELSRFTNCYLVGTNSGRILVRDSLVEDLIGFEGILHRCSISGFVRPVGSQPSQILDCYSNQIPGAPDQTEVDFTTETAGMVIRGWKGPVKFTNKTSASGVCFDYESAAVTVDSTVTAGTVVIAGAGGTVDDQSGVGATIVTSGAMTADMLIDTWQIMGLDAGSPMTVTPTSRVAGGVSQVITGDGETTSTATRQ